MILAILVLILFFSFLAIWQLSIDNEKLNKKIISLKVDNESKSYILKYVPEVVFVEGNGIENVITRGILRKFASLELGDIIGNEYGSYIITRFIGIIDDNVYFKVQKYVNDNPEQL